MDDPTTQFQSQCLFTCTNWITIKDVDHDGRPRWLGDVACVIAGVALTGIGDVEATDGTVGQQVGFDTWKKSKEERRQDLTCVIFSLYSGPVSGSKKFPVTERCFQTSGKLSMSG